MSAGETTAASTVRHRVPVDEQRLIAQEAREVIAKAPLMQMIARGGAKMRVRVTSAGKLGWVGDGNYSYKGLHANGQPWPPIPERWTRIADMCAGKHAWDSAILNWYSVDAGLGWHVDQAEHNLTLPIVTISIGDAASWAVRASDTSRVTRTRLESGDVTVLEGPARNYLHTIERIISAPLLSPLPAPGRLSITLRVAGKAA